MFSVEFSLSMSEPSFKLLIEVLFVPLVAALVGSHRLTRKK